MYGIGLKMLLGDQMKYLGLVLGVAFATVLITQQSAIFVGVMERTVNVIDDAREVGLWVMNPDVDHLDVVRPLPNGVLARVRSVPGVAWAVPLSRANAQLRTRDGRLEVGVLVGLDDATLIGAPTRFRLGSSEDLRRPDAVAIDAFGYARLWPGEPLVLGRELELNERRAVVTAITEATGSFATNVMLHTLYSRAGAYVPSGRNRMSYVVAAAAPGEDRAEVARRIAAQTGFQALTSDGFRRMTLWYFLTKTGIPINFGVVVLLGIVVGATIIGMTFSMFIAESMRQYGTLKAMGMSDRALTRMVMAQVAVVGAIGYALGLAATAGFFAWVGSSGGNLRGFTLPREIALGAAVLIAAIVVAATWNGLKRVRRVDPALVFR
jgi:putative ABC transport system permease protein